MKNRILLQPKQVFGLLLIFSLLLSSCSVTNTIIEENDIVNSSKRFELKFLYRNYSIKSPLNYMEQSIVKEIASNGEIAYTVYDILSLMSLSYNLDAKVYLIIDNDVFPMVIEKMENENTKGISESRQDITTSDSTSMSVVTGYSENNIKVTRFTYKLNDEVVKKILASNQILFRYYSGPSMITLTLDKQKLKKFKELMARQ